jgi:hypothetical protein
MLLNALRCTVARICIKIVHVVKVLSVRDKQFESQPVLSHFSLDPFTETLLTSLQTTLLQQREQQMQ